MACSDILNGIGRQCKTLIGGVQKLYVFNNLDDPFTIVANEATAINPLLTQVYEFDVIGDGTILEENLVSDDTAKTTINTQTITAFLGGVTATKNATLQLLVKGHPMAVIQDRNGYYRAVGVDFNDGINFNAPSTTGGAKADQNGYTLTGVSIGKDYAPVLDSATVTAFLALVVAN